MSIEITPFICPDCGHSFTVEDLKNPPTFQYHALFFEYDCPNCKEHSEAWYQFQHTISDVKDKKK